MGRLEGRVTYYLQGTQASVPSRAGSVVFVQQPLAPIIQSRARWRLGARRSGRPCSNIRTRERPYSLSKPSRDTYSRLVVPPSEPKPTCR